MSDSPHRRSVGIGALAVATLAMLLIVAFWYVNRANWLSGGPATVSRWTGSKYGIRNVLLISIDTCRPDFMHCYGYAQKTTPNIDALAAEACLFENAISPVPITLPAHCTMLTGTNPPYHGIHDNGQYQLASSHTTLAEIAGQYGLVTGAVVGAFVLNNQFGLNQGFDTYDDQFQNELSPIDIPERRADEVSRHAIDWLKQHQREPFFLFVHYYDPHQIYDPPEPFKSRFAGDEKAQYAGEIAYTDQHVGRLISSLKQLSLYDSTLIIITSDHGEMLGEHDEFTHSFFVYQSALKIPLIIKVPGRHGPRRITDLVGLVDIVPTVCSLMGMDGPAEVHGLDLLDSLVGQASPRRERRLYCESLTPTKYDAAALLGIVTDRWKYIHTARPELYDLASDPLESNNQIAVRPGYARPLRDQLQQYLNQWHRDDEVSGRPLDRQTIRRLQALGYVGGSVTENFDLDSAKENDDPKDLVNFYELNSDLHLLFEKKRYSEARAMANRMLAQRPDFADGYMLLARIASQQNNPAQAEHYLKEVLSRNGDDAIAHLELGTAMLKLDKPDEAAKHFELALGIRPNFDMARYELGTLLQAAGKHGQAIGHFRLALAVNPDFPEVLHNMAVSLMAGGDIDGAVDHYQQALRADPDFLEAHYNLASVLAASGRWPAAVEHFRKVLAIDIDSVEAMNNLAWIFATCPDEQVRDPANGLQLAQRAADLTDHANVSILDTLGAAHAIAGQFDHAIATARRALTMAHDAGHTALAEQIRQRLQLYEQGKAYRQQQPAPRTGS